MLRQDSGAAVLAFLGAVVARGACHVQTQGSDSLIRGHNLTSIDLFRTRFATATQTRLREEVVVLRWRPSVSNA